MKKDNIIAILIAVFLFFIPFFWLKPGFVDFGGDSGRLYFIEPLKTAKAIIQHPSLGAPSYSMIPYELYLYTLKQIIPSPTMLINIERGLQLSISFFSMYLIALLLLGSARWRWVAIASGFVYLALIAKSGWTLSLVTHNQVFLNPLIFYLLHKFLTESALWYGFFILLVTLLFSGSFGFSAAPQLFSYYPFALAFLLLSLHIRIPWRRIAILIILFFVLHSFHLVPLLLTFLDKQSQLASYVFTGDSIQNSGVHYFQSNHEVLGKISKNIFQPGILIAIVAVMGYLKRPTKLLVMSGIFFAISLFLVSANITHIGVALYEKLFFIPGFMMFRQFDDKWYFVFAFFYAIVFAFAFANLVQKKMTNFIMITSLVIIMTVIYKNLSFFSGEAIREPYFQSKNVSPVFRMDSDLLNAVSYVRQLPDGKVLTLPLTFPYYQIAYGGEGGAYVGISLIMNLTDHDDYPGFWSMGKYAQPVFEALRANDRQRLLSLFSELEIKYIFYNSDSRIMDNFPDFPYIYPGLMYSSKDQVPAIRDQAAYKTFLGSLPLVKLYEKGFYFIYEIHY